MRDLLIIIVYSSFFFYGMRAPFVLLLGYVWVDIFTPQLVSYGIMQIIPVSMIIAIAALLSLIFTAPPIKLINRTPIILMFAFACWMTLTLFWAAVPEAAWEKWDWAFKGVLVACLVPLFIRGRTELEALIWTIVLAGMAHCIPFGIKVLISGGGYGQAKGLVANNTGYGEGSTLAMFSVSLIPLCFYLMKHSQIIPLNKFTKTMLGGFVIVGLLTSLGTFARTGLVCSAVLALAYFFRSKRKLLYLTIIFTASIVLVGVMGDEWSSRMETITDATESSSMGRVAAWLWAWEYVQNHQFGGSFGVSAINQFVMSLADGSLLEIKAKAFHNIYFEVLAETGFPGIIIYGLIIASTLKTANHVRASTPDHNPAWLRDLGASVLISSFIFLAGGMFIGVAFQSYFYYLAAISVVMMNISTSHKTTLLKSAAN